jgi:hypothetical protein
MPSLIFNSALDGVVRGKINFENDAFKVLLTGPDYRQNKDADSLVSEVADEVSGFGYAAGGLPVTVSVSKDTEEDRIDITLGGAVWPLATIRARKAVYYKEGGELIAVVDFGSDVISTNGEFALSESTIRIQN